MNVSRTETHGISPGEWRASSLRSISVDSLQTKKRAHFIHDEFTDYFSGALSTASSMQVDPTQGTLTLDGTKGRLIFRGKVLVQESCKKA